MLSQDAELFRQEFRNALNPQCPMSLPKATARGGENTGTHGALRVFFSSHCHWLTSCSEKRPSICSPVIIVRPAHTAVSFWGQSQPWVNLGRALRREEKNGLHIRPCTHPRTG